MDSSALGCHHLFNTDVNREMATFVYNLKPDPDPCPYPDAGPYLRQALHIPPDIPINLFAIPDPPPGCRPDALLASLVELAIYGSPLKKLSLQDIYSEIERRFEYYRNCDHKWKASIRHMLSFKGIFVSTPRQVGDPGRGSYWQLDVTQAAKHKRPRKRTARKGKRSGMNTRTGDTTNFSDIATDAHTRRVLEGDASSDEEAFDSSGGSYFGIYSRSPHTRHAHLTTELLDCQFDSPSPETYPRSGSGASSMLSSNWAFSEGNTYLPLNIPRLPFQPPSLSFATSDQFMGMQSAQSIPAHNPRNTRYSPQTQPAFFV